MLIFPLPFISPTTCLRVSSSRERAIAAPRLISKFLLSARLCCQPEAPAPLPRSQTPLHCPSNLTSVQLTG